MIVFGSRGSDLALTQTRMVAEQVKRATGLDYRIDVLVTTGDRIQERPLSGIGVKGLFTRELEDALRHGAIDAAVHSLKDLPVEDQDGITLGAVPPREDPADVLVTRAEVLDVSRGERPFEQLPPGARLGTSSPRRALAAVSARADLTPTDIRGNVPTRVDKARNGGYDAVLLARAGLARLGLDLADLVTENLSCSEFPPAPGQGALGVQCRVGDARVLDALAAVHDATTARCVGAERAVLLGLGGGCSMPLGVLVEPLGGRFRMHAALFGGSPNAALREASIGDDPTAMAAALVEAWRPLVGEPLRGMRLATIRPDGGRTGLCAALAIAGADVTSLAWTAVEPTAPSREGLADVLACDALAFTSARAVTHFAAACRAHGLAPFARPALAVGAATASELLRLGCEDVRVADGRGGASLAALCADAGVASVGLPCAMERHDGFERAATARGVNVLPLPVYRLRQVDGGGAAPYHLDAVLFTSPSAVDAWCERASDRAVRAVAIGATTTTALTERGFKALTTLREPTPAALIAALTAAGGSR